ncbi:MAG: penicillin-binding protein activator LpoB [Oligoflexia bacterium]|nr:penicillin-binding protein activator LpoB [Oligoflexia bacterium]
MKNFLLLISLVFTASALTSCGPTAFTKGDYDNPENENLLNDLWSETDMQNMVKKLVASLNQSRPITKAQKPPVVMVTKLENKTEEHIDTQSIMDMVKVELGRSGNVQFVDKEARGDVADEYDYQSDEKGMMDKSTAKKKGKQIGADYILNGRLDQIVQSVGKNKTVYYKLTLYLTNLSSNISEWQDYDQIRKVFKKRHISM